MELKGEGGREKREVQWEIMGVMEISCYRLRVGWLRGLAGVQKMPAQDERAEGYFLFLFLSLFYDRR